MKNIYYKTILLNALLMLSSCLAFSQTFNLKPSSITLDSNIALDSDNIPSTTFWCNNVNNTPLVTYKWTIGPGWEDIFGNTLQNEFTTFNNMLTAVYTYSNCPPSSITVTPHINHVPQQAKICNINFVCCTTTPPSLSIPDFTITDDSAEISIGSIPASNGYQLQYKYINSDNWETLNTDIPFGSVLIENLYANGSYHVRVRSKCTNGNYSIYWSNIETFTTKPLCNATPPSTITLSQNTNIPSNLGLGINVEWDMGPSYYNWQFEFQFKSENDNAWTFGGYHFTTLTNLSPSTTYHVRVRKQCSTGGYGEWSYEASFFLAGKMAQVTIFPNPAKDKINLESDIPIQNWEVVNYFGRSLIKNQLLQAETKTELNINSLPIGMYFIKIQFENGDNITKRFIKQ